MWDNFYHSRLALIRQHRHQAALHATFNPVSTLSPAHETRLPRPSPARSQHICHATKDYCGCSMTIGVVVTVPSSATVVVQWKLSGLSCLSLDPCEGTDPD